MAAVTFNARGLPSQHASFLQPLHVMSWQQLLTSRPLPRHWDKRTRATVLLTQVPCLPNPCPPAAAWEQGRRAREDTECVAVGLGSRRARRSATIAQANVSSPLFTHLAELLMRWAVGEWKLPTPKVRQLAQHL